MIVQTDKDLKKLQEIGAIVANCLIYMKNRAAPGMSTLELDKIGADFLRQHGARSAPILMYKFPGTTCISLNEEAAHGIPSAHKILKPGDLINIDVSAEKDGIFADTGASFQLAPENPERSMLMKYTKKALKRAISEVEAGKMLNCIGRAIEKEKGQYTIIRNLCSHGVGRSLHEEPDSIPSYYDPKEKRKLAKNMVITIEPFLSTGCDYVEEADDGWTLMNDPGHVSAQFEHTMVIQERRPPIIVTQATEDF